MAIPTYVPLIISLIALVVPILNLLRILFETADGYRKCSEAVIGPWSKLRWRRWSWSEFRFEVHFVTPKLELHDISEARLRETSYRECFLTLRDIIPRKQDAGADAAGYTKSPPWYSRSATRHWNFFNSAKRAHALVQSGRVLDSCLMQDFDNRTIYMERRSTLSVMHGDEERFNSPPVKHRFVSDQRVSWLSFLRHLYRVQSRTASTQPPQLLPDLGPDPWVPLLLKPECANLDLMKHRHPTGVSVSFVEWTWDSLPTKATRPMATTTLGTLVVMATRLGMQWRIDLEKDSYQASGNGYSLSCTQVPEMGLVATFTAEERDHRQFPCALAFNSPTDKFMCGIIPGAGSLVDKDFHCTDDTGRTDGLEIMLDAIFPEEFRRQQLYVQPEGSSEDEHTHWKDMLSSEITALLCEFLPSEGANGHIFAGWRKIVGGVAMCLLNSPQFFDAFLRHVQRCSRDGVAGTAAKDVADQMSKLAELDRAGDGEQLMQYTQHVFERTTLWFVSNGFDQERHRRKLYLHLVSAHCSASYMAWDALASRDRADALKDDIEGYASEYLERGTWRISRYLSNVGYYSVLSPALQKLCNEAWLVMMLRGIAWFKSQNVRTKLSPVKSGGAIPSSCWDNQRPIWII
jgi:hypothetical protein